MSRRQVRHLPKDTHVHPRLEHDKHCEVSSVSPPLGSTRTMRRIMVSDLFRFLANVEPCGTVRATEPDAPDLVRVDVAQCLSMQHVFEVGDRVSWVDDGSTGNLSDARSIHKRQECSIRPQREMSRPIEPEEDVPGVMDPVRP